MSKDDQVNVIRGIVPQIRMTAAEFAANADAVFTTANVLIIVDTTTYITDGTSKLSELAIYNKAPLSDAAVEALESAFDENGDYQAVAGGVVVLNEEGKVDRDSLDFFEGDKISLDVLPELVSAGITHVANIEARDAITDSKKDGLIIVHDASGDDTVTAGSATYTWDATLNEGAGGWKKISEQESMDLVIDSSLLENNNAVLYSHPILVQPPAIDDLISLYAPAPVAP